LKNVQREIPFSLAVRKLVFEDPCYEELKEKIPVMFIYHEEAFDFRVDKPPLRRRFLTLTP
jgi:hypothetical protein